MLKDRVAFFRKIIIVSDALLAGLAFYAACRIKDQVATPCLPERYFPVGIIFVLSWMLMLYSSGIYDSLRTKKIFYVIFLIAKAALLSLLLNGALLYIFHLQGVSRLLLLLAGGVCFALVFIFRALLMLLFQAFRRKGYNFRRLLVIGSGKRAQHFITLLEDHEEWGLKVVGVVDKDPAMKGKKVKSYQVIGAFADIPQIIKDNVIDEVVFVVPRSWLDSIEDIILFLEANGLTIHVAVDYFELKIARARQNDLHGFPLLTFENAPSRFWQIFVKRLVDIIVSALSLLCALPFFAALALIIKLDSRGPVFFKQQRSGLNGRKFTLYKFRTMVADAEDRLDELREFNEMQGPVFKIKNDPRLTRIGKFLRKFSIDEFPQLWNVFKGDMSLIGPRPPLPEEVMKYDYWQRRRLSMKPGLSCLWQVSGRNKISDFNEWMRLDLEYIDNWSLWLDGSILLRTIPAVLLAKGAR